MLSPRVQLGWCSSQCFLFVDSGVKILCGISGVFNRNGGLVDESIVRAMNSQMVSRGPDDEGVHFDAGLGLGFRRLSIIDLEHGHQPLCNEDRSLWLVMNGEIYNYKELRKDLLKRGHQFRTEGDAEVILHLYEEHGEHCVDYLNGMFAFAIYDSKEKKVMLARDRLGIKPLYYSLSPRQLIFASDLIAIQKVMKSEVSRNSLIDYLALSYVPEPKTLFSGVKKLPPGHLMVIHEDKYRLHRYWDLEAIGKRDVTPEQAMKDLWVLLEDALRLQLRADVPLGIFLSGGVDSSALLAAASSHVKRRIHTYTINYDGKGGSDALFARQIAEQYCTIHHEVIIRPEDAKQYLADLGMRMDEPIADSASIATYALSLEAKKDGVKVLLTGAGGDELFGGYTRHWPARFGTSSWLMQNTPAWVSKIFRPILSQVREDLPLRIGSEVRNYGVSESGADIGFLNRILSPLDFEQIVNCYEKEYNQILVNEREYGFTYSRMLNDLKGYLVNNILALTDKATMAASVEGRVPLIDHRLVEYAFELAPHINVGLDAPKKLFKQSLAARLPDKLLNRPKEGFNAPVRSWVMASDAKELEQHIYVDLAPPLKEIVDPVALRKTIFDQKKRRLASESLYSIYVFNHWWKSRRIEATDAY